MNSYGPWNIMLRTSSRANILRGLPRELTASCFFRTMIAPRLPSESKIFVLQELIVHTQTQTSRRTGNEEQRGSAILACCAHHGWFYPPLARPSSPTNEGKLLNTSSSPRMASFIFSIHFSSGCSRLPAFYSGSLKYVSVIVSSYGPC